MPESSLLRRLLREQPRRAQKPAAAAGLPPPTSFGELSAFEKAIDVISRPLYATAGAAKAMLTRGNPFAEAIKGFAGQTRTTYSDVLRAAGFRKDVGTAVMGFAADVLLDPLTYVGIGPVGAAGRVTVKGVARPLSKAGLALLRGAEAAAPRFTPARLTRVAAGAQPEFRALAKTATAQEAPALFRRIYGQRVIERAIAKPEKALPLRVRQAVGVPTAPLVAPTALKFAGLPLVTGPQFRAAVRPIGEAAKAFERIPGIGPRVASAVRGVGAIGAQFGKAVRAVFSPKLGVPVADVARVRARDIRHLKDVRAGEFWIAMEQDVRKLVGDDAIKVKAAKEEWVKAIEGIEAQVIREVPLDKALARGIAKFESELARLAGVGAMYRMAEVESLKLAERLRTFVKGGAVEREALERLPGAQARIEAEAARQARRQAQAHVRAIRQGGILERLERAGVKLYWVKDPTAKKWVNAEELVQSGVPRKFIAADPEKVRAGKVRGLAVDDAATQFGFADAESMIRAIETEAKALAAEKARGIAAPKLAKVPPAAAVAGQAIPIPPGALAPAAPLTAEAQALVPGVAQAEFARTAAARRAQIAGEIGRLQQVIAKAKTAPERLAAERPEYEALRKRAVPKFELQRARVAYEPKLAGIKELAGRFRERMAMMLADEKRLLALPPEERRLYFPHVLRREIDDSLVEVIRQQAGLILKEGTSREFSENLTAAMRRTQDKGVLELTLGDLAASGRVDVAKLERVLAAKGIRLSEFDKLVFEADPVVAGMKRELAHNRAITAAEFTNEILTSPAIVKSKGNLADPAEFRRLREITAQHPDHAIFVPSKTYVDVFLTDAQRQALRRGAPDAPYRAVRDLFHEASEEAVAAARKRAPDRVIEAYVIPREIAEHLSKAFALPQTPEALRGFLQSYDALLGWWKTMATAPRPAFHIRNLVSNLWQSWLAGMTTPQSYHTAAMMQRGGDLAKLAPVGGFSPQQIRQMAEELGILKAGFIGGDVAEYVERSLRPVGVTIPGGAFAGIPGLGLFHHRGPLARMGMRVGTAVEDNARLALFIDGLAKNMDPQAASQRVKKYLFDYGELSNIEKSVFKRLVPFYTFTRKSVPLALETLVTQPGKVSILGKIRAEAEDAVGSLDHEYVADYINESFGVPVRRDPETGAYQYFLLKGYIPTVDLAKMDAKELLGMLSPIVKEPIEQFLNIDFFRMKPISRFPTETVQFMGLPMPARAAHLIRNVVIMQQIDREIFRADATPLKAALSELSIRLQGQDPVDQMRRYVLSTQVEMGEMKRAAERAREAGRERMAGEFEARLALLVMRRDHAKREVLKLKPDAFKVKRGPQPAKPERIRSLESIRRGLRRPSLRRLLGAQPAAVGSAR